MIVAVIPAKKDSKRLPNKNILRINGKSLLAHTVEFARASKKIGKIIVSTDSDEIAGQATGLGAEVVRRSAELAGETPLLRVYEHAWRQLGEKGVTHIVGIQPDHPDRKINPDVAIEYVIEKNIDDLFTVDRCGRRNGSLRILSVGALRGESYPYSASMMDDCTNIHSLYDYFVAKRNMESGERINIAERELSSESPVFVVAEAACNHMCDIRLARKMIDEAADAGADAIKFQTYKAEKLVTKDAVAFWGKDTIRQIDYYRRLDRFGMEEYAKLFRYAKKKGLIGFSSAFDFESSDMLNDIGMPVFKIASCEIPNLRFIRHVAGYGKPIMLSTGASKPAEIDRAVETIFGTGNTQLILMACTLSYPTQQQDANFMRLTTLKHRYPGVLLGLSDHTEPEENMVIPSVAVALGARVIEKHYTSDRTMVGSGHFFSVDPAGMRKMVDNIRITERVLGDGVLGVADCERKAFSSARRSIVAEVPIKKGEVIEFEMLGTKRPATGLDASMIDSVVGKKAGCDISREQQITLDMLET